MIKTIQWLVLATGILIPFFADGQVNSKSHRRDRELLLSYDNDFFFLTDQYYSSGANITYARSIKESSKFYKQFSSKKTDSSKVITRYNYGHQIITPTDIENDDVIDFDRPYAGWHYTNFHILNFPKPNVMNTYSAELGLIGERSGIGNFQEWWHNTFNILGPEGWDFEIDNEVVLNLSYNRLKAWKLVDGIDIVTDSGVKFGNGQNKISQNATLRLGRINNLSNSGYTNSRLSNQLPDVQITNPSKEEFMFFFGYTAEYVFSNIFIEGSLFNDNSPHTEELEPLVFVNKLGIIYTNYYTSFSIVIYQISKEAVGTDKHRYLSLSLGFRF